MQMSQSKIRTSQNSPTFLDHTRNCLIKKNSDRAGYLNAISSRVMGGGGERGNSYESIFKISNARIDRRNVFVIYQRSRKKHIIEKQYQTSLLLFLSIKFIKSHQSSGCDQHHYSMRDLSIIRTPRTVGRAIII